VPEPTVAHRPDPLRVGHAGGVEVDLVEVDLTGDVGQRAHLDPGLVEVDEEVRDALALGGARVGAGQQHTEVGKVRPRGPHLLTGDDPLVAIRLGPTRERRQVAARARLAEQLAPDLLGPHDRRQEAQPLLLGAVGEQRRRGQVQAEGVESAQVERREDGLDGTRLGDAEVETAVGDRPGRSHQARSTEHGVPVLVVTSGANLADRRGAAACGRVLPCLGDVLGDPGLGSGHGVIDRGAGVDLDRNVRPGGNGLFAHRIIGR